MVIAVAPLFYQIHMHASLSSKIDALHLTDYSYLRENAEAPVVIRMLDNFGMLPYEQAKSSGGDDVPRQLYNESSDTGFNTIARKRYFGGLVLPNVLLVGAQKGKVQKCCIMQYFVYQTLYASNIICVSTSTNSRYNVCKHFLL